MLRNRLGARRVEEDPEAAVEIVTRCARLPLALSIAAARVSNQPHLSLSTLADQLADPDRTSLDVLRSGDRATDVREVLSWSTEALEPEPARLFRLLGLHPGPDFTPEATAHLIDRTWRKRTDGWTTWPAHNCSSRQNLAATRSTTSCALTPWSWLSAR